MMLKILRLFFEARIELFNNNGCLAPMKTKTQQRCTKHNGKHWAFNMKRIKATKPVELGMLLQLKHTYAKYNVLINTLY